MKTKKIILANFIKQGQQPRIEAFESMAEFISARLSILHDQVLISEIDYTYATQETSATEEGAME